jgi:hypothetical protein
MDRVQEHGEFGKEYFFIPKATYYNAQGMVEFLYSKPGQWDQTKKGQFQTMK